MTSLSSALRRIRVCRLSALVVAGLLAEPAPTAAHRPVDGDQPTPNPGALTRLTAAPGTGPSATVRTSHLTVQAAASDTAVSPGRRFSLSIEVTPRRGMHVYAPGKHDYQVVRFVPDSRPWLQAQPLTYPPSEIYHFVPLDERVETYLKPFTLVQDLIILATPEAQKQLAGEKTVTVSGTLEYQACDDKICYAPAKVPLSFTLELTRPVPPGR
jgi:hypothetical protein